MKNDNAVADMVGMLTMLLIAIALFSVVYYFVFSIEQPDETYRFNAMIYGSEFITIEHYGGDAVPIDDMEFFIQQDLNKYVLNKLEIIKGNHNDYWEIGEVISYKNYGYKGHCYLIDKQTGNVVLRGTIK